MEVPQSQSPSAPPRLRGIAAYWDVAARCSGVAGLRGCGRHGRVTSGLWDCGTAGLRGRGAVGHRDAGSWDHDARKRGGDGPGPRRRRVAVWSWGCRRGRILGRPRRRGTAVHRGCGAWPPWDSAVGAFPDPSPWRRAKGGPAPGGRGAGLGWLKRGAPRAGPRRRGARRPKAVTM